MLHHNPKRSSNGINVKFFKDAYLSRGEGYFFVSNRLLGHLVGRLGHPRHRLVLGSFEFICEGLGLKSFTL